MGSKNRNLGGAAKRARQARYDFRVQEIPLQAGVRRVAGARIVASHLGNAAQVIGSIVPGLELCGLTNGQFSMIDIIEHVLEEVGPADLALSTWTTGIYDQNKAVAFYQNGRIRSARVLVDPLIFERRPESVGPMVSAFGVEAFRAVNTHSKFAVITNERFSVTVRGSMNLNKNTRLENFDLSESREVAGFFLAVVDAAFAQPATAGPQRSAAFFEGLIAAGAVQPVKPASPWADTFAGLGEIEDLGTWGDNENLAG
jgi:hypothetical protein